MRGDVFCKYIAGVAALLLLGAGCKSKGDTGLTKIPSTTVVTKTVPSPFPPTRINPPNPFPPSPGPIPYPGPNPPAWPPLTEGFTVPYDFERDVFQRVHFDYDSSELRAGDTQLVEVVAAHLLQNPTHLLLVEGHCDERGTEEYNLSLGERRALAVVDELIRFGISGDRMHTESYGEKVPLDESDKAEARSKNRRGEFVLVVPASNRQPAPSRRINLGSGQ
jgi:outer membrane protein OmpA-like peptidoglycan-associated protein